jgi:hypothetical protein
MVLLRYWIAPRPRAEGFKVVGNKIQPMNKNFWRAVIEVAFIIFLFYANLLMGEFERSGLGRRRGLTSALIDVFTLSNFAIAAGAAVIGYFLFEFLRSRF